MRYISRGRGTEMNDTEITCAAPMLHHEIVGQVDGRLTSRVRKTPNELITRSLSLTVTRMPQGVPKCFFLHSCEDQTDIGHIRCLCEAAETAGRVNIVVATGD